MEAEAGTSRSWKASKEAAVLVPMGKIGGLVTWSRMEVGRL